MIVVKLVRVNLGLKRRKIWQHLCSEEGNVESTLVLIPSLLIFLIVIQLAFSVFERTSAQLTTQEFARVVALDGYSNIYAKSKNISTSLVAMPSGKKLVVTRSLDKRKALSQAAIPFFGEITRNVFGIAISEQD
jgi:hypothetical protein